MEINAATSPVPNPFIWDEAAEAAAVEEPDALAQRRGEAAVDVTEEAGVVSPITVANLQSPQETLREVQRMLNIEVTPEMDLTTQWQTFINALPSASLPAQQLLTSLRYDPNRGWWTASVPQLVHPAYT